MLHLTPAHNYEESCSLVLMATTYLEELLTKKEASRVLASSLRTVDGLIASGNLQVVRIGKSVRIRPSELERFISARESRVNPKAKKQRVGADGKGGAA